MNLEELNKRLVAWIREKVEAGGARGVVLGMSGGIDSAVVAVLCKQAFPRSILGIALPCKSDPQDEGHARAVADKFSIPLKVIALDSVFDALLRVLPEDNLDPAVCRKAQANLKPRLRMLTLYYFANRLNYLVAGAGNRSELATGYFTKHGDSGVDILPLGNLVKAQVRELAYFLGVQREIIDKPPSAGLWEGQTDEDEIGLTYEKLDRYLLRDEAPLDIKEKIEYLIACSRHKRQMPSVPDF